MVCCDQGEVSYHQKHVDGDLFFDFGRLPRWNCPVAGKQQPDSLLPERPRSTSASSAKGPSRVAATQATREPAVQSRPAAAQPARSAGPQPVAAPKQPWFIPPIQCNEPEDGVFFAQVTRACADEQNCRLTGVLYCRMLSSAD